MSQDKKTGAEGVRWDHTQLYADLNDPKIDADLDACEALIKQMGALKGKLSTKLGEVLTLDQKLERTAYDLYVYPMLLLSENPDNTKAQQISSKVAERLGSLQAVHTTYISIEIAAISDADYQALLKSDKVVAHHKPMLDNIRKNAQYQLSEDQEAMLAHLSPYGPGVMSEYRGRLESELDFTIPTEDGKGEKTIRLTEALDILEESKDRNYRKAVLLIINKTFNDVKFDRFSTKALNSSMGYKATMDKMRGYDPANPMQAKNLGNMIDDATVEALHDAGKTRGANSCAEFYRLKAAILNKADGVPAGTPLEWSDRNAPMPLNSDDKVDWADCMVDVKAAYGAFSPTLLSLVERMESENWIDAPYVPGKQSGAYNCSGPYSGGDKSWNFLNYLGTRRDVMTVAHELGHGVHGLLALEAQGELMWARAHAVRRNSIYFC